MGNGNTDIVVFKGNSCNFPLAVATTEKGQVLITIVESLV